MYRVLATASALLATARAQQACTLNSENKPALTWSKCTSSGCNNVRGSVVVDANWRWTHSTDSSTNCYSGNTWDKTLCPDGKTCASKCCLDGADYSGTYGVTSSGSQLNLKFVTVGPYSTNVGSRLYLMEDDNNYQMFDLLGNEFTFDVDVNNIGCGLNGALYFVSMDKDGGKSRYSTNKAGAKYGTGYCDAQCPRDVKFINGVVSISSQAVSSGVVVANNHHQRPTRTSGSPRPATRTPVLESSAPAAPRWISGRPTRSRRPTRPIPARASPSSPARAMPAAAPTLPPAMLALAIPTVAISTLTARATFPSTAPAPTSTSTPPRR